MLTTMRRYQLREGHEGGRFVGCTCDDMMARARLSFPFPANGAAAVGSNVVAAVTARAPQVSMFPSVCAAAAAAVCLSRVHVCVYVVEIESLCSPWPCRLSPASNAAGPSEKRSRTSRQAQLLAAISHHRPVFPASCCYYAFNQYHPSARQTSHLDFGR